LVLRSPILTISFSVDAHFAKEVLIGRLVVGTLVLGARVDRHLAEEFRVVLARQRLVDIRYAIADDGDAVVIPLTGEPEAADLDRFEASVVHSEFRARDHKKDPIEVVRETVSIPEELKPLLPEKWEQLGDVLSIRLPRELNPFEREIGEAYGRALGLKAVLRDIGGISGQYRTPVMRLVWGNDPVALHRENDVLFRFDASKIMFSSGNVDERLRMADTPCDGETIVDMFAGIGYFSLPLAVHQTPKHIVACEINETAYSYLVENVALNKVGGKVEAILGDNRDLPGEGFADRVIMGYVKTTHEFLPTAIRVVKDGGMLHYHETCPNALLPDRPVQRIRDSARNCRVEVLKFREVKSYSPGVSHVVVDARIVKP